MTERLYYDCPAMTDFEARVTGVRTEKNGRYLLALDRTAFYPTSGGQPNDTGTLRQGETVVRVLDVCAGEDGEVWHAADAPLPVGAAVHGQIDWARRRDQMEQHGGEHLLAGALWRMLGGVTEGLHTGREEASIDVALPGGRTRVTAEEKAALEDEVNDEIRRDVPVRQWFPAQAELTALPLRKPPAVAEHVRVVAFGDFEYCACGGTHPVSSGRIGLLKIISVTPMHGKARFTFVCGGRALRYVQKMCAAAEEGARLLSCTPETLGAQVEKAMRQQAELKKEGDALRLAFVCEKAERGWQDAERLPGGGRLLTLLLPEGDMRTLAACAAAQATQPGRTALMYCPDGQGAYRLAFARSGDGAGNMRTLMQACGARGGGRPELAQGSGTAENVRRAQELLRTAFEKAGENG